MTTAEVSRRLAGLICTGRPPRFSSRYAGATLRQCGATTQVNGTRRRSEATGQARRPGDRLGAWID
jgi:hypothetical protein